MKKTLFTLTLTLALFTTAQAEKYMIWIGGVQVTDSNKDNINPSGKSSGTIWYDSSDKTLYFRSVTMVSDENCIMMGEKDATVYFEGNNSLTSNGSYSAFYCVFEASKSVTLDGPTHGDNARVSFTSDSENAIWFGGAGDLNICNLYVTAISKKNVAIQGPLGSDYAELWTSCAQIEATSADGKPAVAGFNKWYMQDYAKLRGSNKYNPATNRTEDTNGNVASEITLRNGLYVAGQMVRADATSTWAVDPEGLTAGTIKYSNKKLTLDGVNYDGTKMFVCNYNVPDLTIECTGTNIVKTSDRGFFFEGDINSTFTGSGALNITSTRSSAIANEYGEGGNVTMNMAVLMAQGKYYGFYGVGTLTLKKYNENSSYLFAGEKGNILAHDDLVMDGMDIYSSGHYYYKKAGEVYVNGNVASSSDLLHATTFAATSKLTYYDLYVGGTQVSSGNRSYIYSPYFKKGYAMYEHNTNVLILNDVEFEATGSDAPVGVRVHATMGDIMIRFTGDIQNWTTSNDVFDIRTNADIVGDCKFVQLTSTKESGISTRGGVNIKVKTTGYFGAKGAKYGYWGSGGDTLTLSKTADDGYLYGFEGNSAPIYTFDDLVLDNMDFGYIEGSNLPGCYIEEGRIKQNGGQIASGRVVFASIWEKIPITICGKQLNRVLHPDYPIAVGSPDISSSPTSVMYYPNTKTLVLNDATIDYDDNCPIEFEPNSKTTVEVKGNSSVKTSHASAIRTGHNVNVTIQGDGVLNVEAAERGLHPYGDNTTVTITGDVQVKAKGSSFGIGSILASRDEKLIIDGNAIVEASSISGFDEMTLMGNQAVVQPYGAVVKTVSKDDGGKDWGVYVSEDSKELAKNVVIKAAEPGIKGDVNGDGDINTADVTAVYAYIINGADSGFTAEIADVNGDGDVNTADVTAIYSIIIGGTE